MQEKFQHTPESKKPNRELFDYVYSATLKALERYYGVENLSTIEAVRLKHIIDEYLDEDKQYLEEVRKGIAAGDTVFDFWREIAARWVYELYGFIPEEIPSDYVIDEHIKVPNKEEHDKKIVELEMDGKFHTSRVYPTEAFKKYLQKKRKKAHEGWGN